MAMANQWTETDGMSLRDYFAAAALPANMAAYQYSIAKDGDTWDQLVARNCYEMADAMLAERVKAK
jgi:hypothetical protein